MRKPDMMLRVKVAFGGSSKNRRYDKDTIVQKRLFTFCFMLVAALLAFAPNYCRSQEPSQEFLEAMRDGGYFELALEYLDRAEKSKLTSKEFRALIPLERSRTLEQSLGRIRDLEIWEARLTEAQQQLTIYAKNAKDKEAQANAQLEQASLSRKQSRVYMMRSESDRLTKAEKEEQLTLARKALQKSLAGYTKSRAGFNDLLKSLRASTPKGPNTKAKRNKTLETSFLRSRLYMARVQEELSETYTNKKKRNEYLNKAATEYTDMWIDFSHRPQGVDACLFAAKAHLKLKQYKKALERTSDIFLFPPVVDFLSIKRKAAVVSADCWDALPEYPAEEVIEKIQPLVDSLNRRNSNHPEWLKAQLALAKAYRTKAEQVREKNGKPSEINRMNKQAVTLARKVSRLPSDVRDESRELLAEWNIEVDEVVDPDEKPTFEIAKNKSRDMVGDLEVLAIKASQLRASIAAAKAKGNEKAINKLQGELDIAADELNDKAEEILRTLQMALELANESTPREDLNFIRYLQCFTYYSNSKFFEAVVIGEFLLDRYAAVKWTQQASGLVVKSYPRMENGPGAVEPGDPQRLAKVCEQVIKRWPGTPEAIRSADTMAKIALTNKDFAAATKYMETIPKSSPMRAQLALRMGSSVWFSYEKDETKDPAKLQTTTDLLTEGVSGYNQESLTYQGALGALLLTKALLAQGEVQRAIDRLESPQTEIAPLDLVKQKHSALAGPKLTIYEKETYKTAISVYLQAMAKGNPQKWIDRVESVLGALKAIYQTEGEAGQARLVNIYKLVAAQLVNRFNEIEDTAQKVSTARSIDQFLTSLAKESNDANTVLWAGSTMLRLADELGESDAKLQKQMYESADASLRRATEIGFAGRENEARMVQELKRQQAIAKRGAGRYEDAVDLLVEVLRERPSFLQAQIETAVTLQAWGKSAQLSKAYAEALEGRDTYKDPESGKDRQLVWGWKKLMSLTRGNDKLEDVYRQAYLGRIESLYEYGQLAGKQKAVQAAKQEIQNITNRDPEFGGGLRQRKFEELADRINNSN